jgi:hypothetical protein
VARCPGERLGRRDASLTQPQGGGRPPEATSRKWEAVRAHRVHRGRAAGRRQDKGQRSTLGSEEVEVFKVFTFGEPHDQALTLQDCAGREDAMNHLSAD